MRPLPTLAMLAALLAPAGCSDATHAGPGSGEERALAERVEAELRDERALNQVEIDVLGATVVLSGQVASDRDREDAVALVGRIPGVAEVRDDLTVSGAVARDVTSPRIDTEPDQD